MASNDFDSAVDDLQKLRIALGLLLTYCVDTCADNPPKPLCQIYVLLEEIVAHNDGVLAQFEKERTRPSIQ